MATRLLNADADLKIIQGLLGLTTTMTTAPSSFFPQEIVSITERKRSKKRSRRF